MSKETTHSKEQRRVSELPVMKQSLNTLKNSLAIQPMLAFLEWFDTFFKKKKRALVSNEVLFTPGENPNFYIVSSGSLNILRATPSWEKKEIGRASMGSFLGEWVFFGRNQKDTEAVASGDGATVVVLTREDMDFLESQDPKKVLEMYKYIIELTNGRLLETGKELATMYEMTEKIDKLSEQGETGFKQIIDHISKVLSVDYIVYIEQHPIVPGLFVYKYNSNFPSVWPINQKVGQEIKVQQWEGIIPSTGEILGTAKDDTVYILPLKTRENLKGFFTLGKKNGKWIDDTDIRVIHNIAPLLASMIENNQTLAEKKAIGFKQSSF